MVIGSGFAVGWGFSSHFVRNQPKSDWSLKHEAVHGDPNRIHRAKVAVWDCAQLIKTKRIQRLGRWIAGRRESPHRQGGTL